MTEFEQRTSIGINPFDAEQPTKVKIIEPNITEAPNIEPNESQPLLPAPEKLPELKGKTAANAKSKLKPIKNTTRTPGLKFETHANIQGPKNVFGVPHDDNGKAEEAARKALLTQKLEKKFEHRHYFSLHPTCNMILAKRWEEKYMKRHVARLKQAKPSIDNSAPKAYPHLEMRLKGVQIEEERLLEIERNNRILLDRIEFQMVNRTEFAPHIQDLSLMIDAGKHRRKKENEKINKENLVFLQRIEDKAPNYNRYEWSEERRRNLEHLANIAKYPTPYMKILEEYFDYHYPTGKILPRPATMTAKSIDSTKTRSKTAPEPNLTKNTAKASVVVRKSVVTAPEKKVHKVKVRITRLVAAEPEEPLISIPSSKPQSAAVNGADPSKQPNKATTKMISKPRIPSTPNKKLSQLAPQKGPVDFIENKPTSAKPINAIAPLNSSDSADSTAITSLQEEKAGISPETAEKVVLEIVRATESEITGDSQLHADFTVPEIPSNILKEKVNSVAESIGSIVQRISIAQKDRETSREQLQAATTAPAIENNKQVSNIQLSSIKNSVQGSPLGGGSKTNLNSSSPKPQSVRGSVRSLAHTKSLDKLASEKNMSPNEEIIKDENSEFLTSEAAPENPVEPNTEYEEDF